MCCEGLFILLNKRLKMAIEPLTLSTIMSGLGLAVALPPAIFEHAWAVHSIDAASLLAVLYYALIPTIAGFVLWYAGAARVSGTEAALFTALAPVSAVLLAFLLLREPIATRQVLGICSVLAAVFVLAGVKPRHAAGPPE